MNAAFGTQIPADLQTKVQIRGHLRSRSAAPICGQLQFAETLGTGTKQECWRNGSALRCR
jgi:hypothetical protein